MSNRDLEYDIRQSLLEHYSSQTISHATLLLTMAFIGVTIGSLPLGRLVLEVGLSIVAATLVVILFRLLCWGSYAHAILLVNRERGIGKVQTDADHYVDPTLETCILHMAANSFVKKFQPGILWLGGELTWRRWVLFAVAFVGSLVLLHLAYPHLFFDPS